MQFEIEFSSSGSSVLDFNYRYELSASLYKALEEYSPTLAQDLHDGSSRSRLKLFVFSGLNCLPKSQVVQYGERKGFQLGSKVWMRFSSIIPEIAYGMAEALQRKKDIIVRGVFLKVQRISLVRLPDFAPSTTYRPFGQAGMIVCKYEQDGKHFFQLPDNSVQGIPGCSELIAENLRHKLLRLKDVKNDLFVNYLSVSGLDEESLRSARISVDFLPLVEGRAFKTGFFRIKNNSIRAFRAPFRLVAPEAFHRILWECGAGNMNSQGFGLVTTGLQERR